MTITQEECEELEEKTICAGCIGEAYLSSRVEDEGQKSACSYCGDELACITLADLADRIEAAFETHFSRTSDEPNFYESMMLRDKEMNYDWERDGQQTAYAIMDAAEISEDIAHEVQAILEYRHFDFEEATMGIEAEYSEDAHYEEIMPGDEEWQDRWKFFENLIKTEARFFSRTAANYLGELFDKIDQMKTFDGKPLVVDAGPNTDITELYRGRVFHSDKALENAIMRPDQELSAPPAWAAGSGRMNARGISVFYGATSPEIVLAEVRAPVGSSVALARFEITRPLRLLDLTALENLHQSGSIFDPEYAGLLERMAFLKTLGLRMARPVMPGDEEMEYLPTQAIADYLSTESQIPLDGILYPSVQVGGNGLNLVLFHKSARCSEMDIPEGTEISARTYSLYDEGYEPDFTVLEETPPEEVEDEDEAKENKHPFQMLPADYPEDLDTILHEETLKIDPESVHVHEVQAVEIKTASFKVTRHRWEKKEPPF